MKNSANLKKYLEGKKEEGEEKEAINDKYGEHQATEVEVKAKGIGSHCNPRI